MSSASNVEEERVCCRILVLCLLAGAGLFASPSISAAQSKSFRLGAPDGLVATGFLKFLLPRFSLKTGTRIEIVAPDDARDAAFVLGGPGVPAFDGPDGTWVLTGADAGNEHVGRFSDWLTGDVGKKTIDAFRLDGQVMFTAATGLAVVEEEVVISGDIVLGEELSVRHCGRCHVVNHATRFSNIGSTPSFAVMRGFSDWRYRFEAFFALNPHPSFTQVEGVTEPFDISRPSPIVPVEMTLEDLDAILAFVTNMKPADLGAPIQYQ